MARKTDLSRYLHPLEVYRYYRFLKRRERAPRETLALDQDRHVRALTAYCYERVPYYRELFDARRVRPEEIRTVADLARIPVLTKDIVRERFGDLTARDAASHRPFEETTSGSTGAPLRFLLDRHCKAAVLALFCRVWGWHGFRPGMPWVNVRAYTFDDDALMHYSRWVRSLSVSSYHLFDHIPEVMARLRTLKPRMLLGFPSVLDEWAGRLEGTAEAVNLQVRVAVSIGEKLFDRQRQRIERVFGCPVRDVYHQLEHVCMAAECEHGRRHHMMEYGVLELLDEQDRPVADGQQGEMTATGFVNRAMPLLRYRLGDLAVRSREACPCGRQHDIVSDIRGRTTDAVVTPDGRRVYLLLTAIRNLDAIEKAQVVQDVPESVEVRLVSRAVLSRERLATIVGDLRRVLGDAIEIHVRQVQDIPRTQAGKHRLVVSRLSGREEPEA